MVVGEVELQGSYIKEVDCSEKKRNHIEPQKGKVAKYRRHHVF